MRKNGEQLQVAENGANLVLDRKYLRYILYTMKAGLDKVPKVPEKVLFSPDEREKKIIDAGYRKHPGIKRA